MIQQPRIAVAIPTYRRKELLVRMIASIPSAWQVYVSDNDASLMPLAQSLGDNVTVSHSSTLIGMFANWNRALSLVSAQCTHVFIPSDDDLYLPIADDAVARVLRQNPNADIYIFGCDFFDEHDHRWGGYCPDALEVCAPGDGFLKFVSGVDARMLSVLFRHDFLKQIGAFDAGFELTAADSDLVQRALLKGRAVFVPEVIGLYRIWRGSVTVARQASDLWMKEIAIWTNRIADLISAGHQPPSKHVNVARYRDEIIAQNLLAGIRNLQSKGLRSEARAFLGRHQVPRSARASTRLRLWLCRWQLRAPGR